MSQKETRILPCKLDGMEIEDRGRELAAVLIEKEKLEEQRKEINEQIKPKTARIKELAAAIESESEEREVSCEWRNDWDADERNLIRLDTGEIIETDVIPEYERQVHLAM